MKLEELEDAREVEESEEVEGTAAEEPSTPLATPATPELKVVLQMKGDRALVGVQGDGTDPVVEVVTGSLEEVLGAVQGIVARARERWATSPRNPAYQGPPSPPPTAPSRPARRAPATPTAPAAETPRLF